MPRLRALFDRTKEVLDAGRKLLGEAGRGAGASDEHEAPTTESARRHVEERKTALSRVKAKADHGLKPEDRLVAIYATEAEAEAVAEIREALAGIDTIVREMDLAKEPPQTATQLAKLTGVMVPPYVYINGRFWGAQYEVIALRESGDLEHVVANRLDLLGEEARRIGHIHESWSDEVSVENLLARWKLGHIVSVDDLDAWYEVGKDGTEHFYYQGGPHPVEDMPRVAEEIVAAVRAGEYEVHWMLEPAVHLP